MAVHEAWCAPAQSGAGGSPALKSARGVAEALMSVSGCQSGVYRCHLCGWHCDRDQNAALNLQQVVPCFMGDGKRRWRRCESDPRAGDCQRSVYWTRQSLATSPASCVDGEIMAGYSDYAKS